MKNRIELAQYFANLGFTKGVEVGLCTGRYSRILLDNIPDLELIGIDPYSDYEDASVSRNDITNHDNLMDARKALAPYPKALIVIGRAHDVAQWLPDESLDFVFIDGLHSYEGVKQDLEDWVPKVRKGGIVSGHDYYESQSGKLGVVKAVDEYVAEHGYNLQSTGWDNEAFRDDRQPDYWWLK